ncbi:major facilitator superfamily domain-containing protein [Triangularia setosa]|uniref:Major facilitator superfamily domain-containing protein n=1 Tax=Triangularia setosa TaxID=2587417 RepID=A0AAN6W9G2_9PEZI|nr:major facilitator superfamily domain-containing protein [Podospora setosa]
MSGAARDSDVESTAASKKISSVESRRATTGTVLSSSRYDSRSAGTSNPGKLDLNHPASLFCDLIKPYETYQSKLTELPAKKSTVEFVEGDQPAAPLSRRIRNLTGKSTASTSLDTLFKRTVCNMEQLLNKAMDLANQAVDQDDHHCLDMLGTVDHQPDYHSSPPSVHESLPSVYEPSDDEQPPPLSPPPSPPPPVHKKSAEKVVTPRSPTIQSPHIPKHHRSVPGMHSRNVRIEIPKRVTSLRELNASIVHVPLSNLQRSRFQELSPPVSPFTHAPSRSQDNGQNDTLSEEGCILMSRGAKKCRSCRRFPLLNHLFSFSRAKEEDDPPHDTRSRPDAKLRPAGKPISGKIRKSNSWSFDGATDNFPDDSIQDSLLHETDGVGGSAERPYPAQEDHFEQDDPHPENPRRINLRGKSHVSLRGYQGFSLARAYRRHPIARDWSTVRKRFVATVACLSTAIIGVLIGIYAGMVPSIQYMIADLQHYAILGNVFFYIGLAIPSFFFWPLPLLHGRKPYILSSLVLAMPLLFPQAITVSQPRSPYVSTWRWALLSSRAFMGLTLGFASMNFHSILIDLFGASLMSGNPHQEIVDKHDLGLWTWCYTGSLGIGFLLGAVIIDSANPSWGFYVSIILIMFILLLNVICPEVRRSPFRRSVAEVRNGNRISRRVARGEVMMHRVKDGPTWWGQEVYHGILLSLEMLRQPGFLIIALYTGWIYAQVVLIIVLLGALTSRSYQLRSPFVGLCMAFISIGALVAIPFQKANLFSRGRHHQEQSNEDTFDKKFSWTSHLLRRTIFCLVLPLMGVAYTFASAGPPVPVEVPTLLAAMIGVLSGLAISECNGLIMETFDTSDLQPGMTGRPRGASNRSSKRTNYSSFPRATAGFSICHTIGFVLAAVATAVGGSAQRSLGQQFATGVVAGILLILTLLLLAVLIRFKDVQIIPVSKNLEMEKWEKYRRESIRRRSEASTPATQNTMTDAEIWRPILMGNPSSRMRRVNILELGSMSRWTEIRKKNRLIDETAAHLNRAALESAATALEETTTDLVRRVSSRRSNRSPPPRKFYTGNPGPLGVTRSENPIQRVGMTPTAMELDSFIVVRQPPVAATAPTPPSPLPGHSKTRGAGDDFMERECVMGQTVKEEENENGDGALFESSDFFSSSDDQRDVHGAGHHENKGSFHEAGHQEHGHQLGGHFQEEMEGRNGSEIQRR